MRSSSFNIEYLSPTGLIGFWVLFIGLIFTGIMFYFVFFRLNKDYDSYKDKKRKQLANENQKQRYFYPLNQETNFKINKFFRTITKDKNHLSKIISVKGRDFKIENFYDGIARFNFNELCDQNIGAEDYLEIVKNCKFIVIDQIPQFNDINSNQQKRFIILLDVIYDKNIPIAVTANQNLDEFTSSRLLEKPFKRTISRLYELTTKKNN